MACSSLDRSAAALISVHDGNVRRASRVRSMSPSSGAVPVEMYAAHSAWNW